jgi:hypothetical protein
MRWAEIASVLSSFPRALRSLAATRSACNCGGSQQRVPHQKTAKDGKFVTVHARHGVAERHRRNQSLGNLLQNLVALRTPQILGKGLAIVQTDHQQGALVLLAFMAHYCLLQPFN